jgi:WD40 repeat protein
VNQSYALGRDVLLVIAANPEHLARLQLDREVRAITLCFRNAPLAVDVRPYLAATPDDLRKGLLDFHPKYLHFCGHGGGEAGLAFEGNLLTAEVLTRLFGLFATTLKCVVLNSCFSAIQARAVSTVIDQVVGMPHTISDNASIAFATGFYDAIAAGEAVDFAVAYGSIAIQNVGVPEHKTPILYTKPPRALDSIANEESKLIRDWDGAPDVEKLFGRDAAAAELSTWIIEERCRLVLLTGLGGIGKTDLAICLVRGGNKAPKTSELLKEGIGQHFKYIIWRNLFNAPPPEELFAEVIAALSDHKQIINGPTELQIAEILKLLSRKKCLVILDNAEAVLKPGDRAWRYREGYEAYGTFLHQAGKVAHQSCVLITSREKPREIAALEGARKPVRSLHLAGLEGAEALQIFEEIGPFSGDPNDWAAMTSLYRGSPLALDLAARHIQEAYDSNISIFLNSGNKVFAHMQELLDWHLDRLSPEETELIYWLAIEREPVSITTLYDDLLSPDSRESIASTLQSLQRRMPLEKARSQHFAIQPVLVEHITSRLVHQIGDSFSVDLPVLLAIAQRLASEVKWELETGKLRLLNEFALVKATARENVRASQRRLIIGPVIERLSSRYGIAQLENRLFALLQTWRKEGQGQAGYVAGNLINILIQAGADLTGGDLSGLKIWQACLHETELRYANCSHSEFRGCTFRQSFGSVFALSYSPDGKLLAVGDEYGEVRLLDSSDGQTVTRCLGHSDSITGVAFSGDGTIVASSSYDHTVRLWAVDSGACVDTFPEHGSWIYGVAVDKSGTLLASCDERGSVIVRSLKRRSIIASLPDVPRASTAVAFSPDSKMLAVAGRQHAKLIDTSDWSLINSFRLDNSSVRVLTFSPDGSSLLAGADNGKIHQWALADGTESAIPGHTDSVRVIAFDRSGELLVTGGFDASVRFWNVLSNECVASIRMSQNRVWAGCFSPEGQTLALGGEDSTVRILDTETMDGLLTLKGFSNSINALAFSPNNTTLFSGGEDRLVRRWNLDVGPEVTELKGHASRLWALGTSPSGGWMASASDDLTVRLWDLGRNICRYILRGHTGWIRTVRFDSSSSLILSGAEDDRIILWEVMTGERRLTISAGMHRVYKVDFCLEDKEIVAGGADGSIRTFATADGSARKLLNGHSKPICGICKLAEDQIVSISEDGMILCWDLGREECWKSIEIGKAVSSASLGGEYQIILGCEDGAFELWDLKSGTCKARRRAHDSPILVLEVNSDRSIAASAADRGVIRLWDLADLSPWRSCPQLQPPRPYEGMNITGATGLRPGQKETLIALGAIELPY